MAEDAQAFTQLQEISTTSETVLVSWCPTMDVCAVVSADGQLQLHRMDWQMLWSEVPQVAITALCWHPSGKSLATGHKDGSFRVLDTESGQLRGSQKAHYAQIIHLSWCEEPPCSTSSRSQASAAAGAAASTSSSSSGPPENALFYGAQMKSRHKSLFAPLEPPAATGAAAAAAHQPFRTSSSGPYDLKTTRALFGTQPCQALQGSWPPEPKGFDIISVVDCKGRVSLWVHGQVQVAELAVTAPEPEEGPCQVIAVAPTSDLEQLLLLYRTPGGSCMLSSFSLALLRRHHQELQHFAVLFIQIHELLAGTAKALEEVASEWQSAMKECKRGLQQQLQQELEDQGSSLSDTGAEFLLLLATGCLSSVMVSYLTATLGEAGLRKLARMVDAAGDKLHACLLEVLLPALELVVFLLGELRGLAACPGAALPALQLPPTLFRQLELAAVLLLLRGERLRLDLGTVMVQYRSFFSWLLGCVKAAEKGAREQEGGPTSSSNDEAGGVASPAVMSDIMAFLKGQYKRDLLGLQLQTQALDESVQALEAMHLHNGQSWGDHLHLLELVLPLKLGPDADALLGKAAGAGAAAAGWAGQQPYGLDIAAERDQQQQQQQGLLAEALKLPLLAQLQQLVGECGEALELPVTAISPSVLPLSQLQLLPATPYGAAATPGRSSSSSSQPKQVVAAGPPLLSPVQYQDHHLYVCCQLPGEAAAGGQGQPTAQGQQLLLLRVAQQQQQEGRAAGGAAEAAASCSGSCLEAGGLLLELPEAVQLVDAAWYKEQQLALLTEQQADGDEGTGGQTSTLALLDLSAADYTPLQLTCSSSSSSSSGKDMEESVALVEDALSQLQQQQQQQGGVLPYASLPQRQRQLSYSRVLAPLGVSRTRGLALVQSDMQHLGLFDIEEDDQEEVEGEEEEEAEDQEEGMDTDD